VLKSVRDADKKAGRGSDCQRRYVVTESLFRNHGDVIDLPKVVALCEKYFFRLFLDESFSFGVLGATGRGITEHYDVKVSDVAIICGSLAGATAGVGGFSTGSQEVVDYQRINSAGYVFSASPPPFTSACTSEAIRIMRDEPKLFDQLRANANLAHDTLSAAVKSYFHLTSARASPILHVRLLPKLLERVGNEAEQRAVARTICDQVMQNLQGKGIAVISPRYKKHQSFEPLPSVRVSVSAIHSKKDLESACKVIGAECVAVAKQVLSGRSKSRN
jgi:serine palmitoyltransferase